ncbi:hypothetical protein NWP22_12225 [Anabaenopsis tanganyikae CS-531]|uniref:Uncharacterized protein n=1 Tax=Anabaenopsis tanganyikae CS-531 TaxID=2785304 RepID=A0ABT6KGV0_9CYAN|nr:hypothetical protein [Anabaenopsis tanganyikae]MDH6106626.1 hypothetical protein [Anabaenopsis tanganyikae CS-531]
MCLIILTRCDSEALLQADRYSRICEGMLKAIALTGSGRGCKIPDFLDY